MSGQLLSVRNLTVDFATRQGAVRALDDVSFDIAAGEIVGILGESGAGKSVTAYSIMGLLDQAARICSGEILFEGRDVLRMERPERDRWRGRAASMIFQNPRSALNPIRSAGDQIADVIARHTPARPVEIRARTIETLRQVRIPDPERRGKAYPFELSGGMCQRVGIAIALACTPRLLIADEPTTGLDVTTQAVIMDLIRDLARQRGMAVALITHDVALASQYCDRLIVMHAGHVVEVAPPQEVIAKPRHPYTARLLRSVPSLVDSIGQLQAIPGALPDPCRADPPSCGFAERSARPVQEPGMPALLEARKLRKHFSLGANWSLTKQPKLHAVDGVDLVIREGEAVGLVGESGCGKSTLSRLVSRLLEPSEGELFIEGEDIGRVAASRFSRSDRRRLVQMVFQDPTESLNPLFSAFDLIADPARMLLPRVGKVELRRQVEVAAEAVGLPLDLLERLPHQLSGGQKARVGLARALVVAPRLLVLDEPTSSLDVSVQATVLQLLDKLRRERGIALLFVSHDLNVVRLLCDRIMVMYLGQVVESGTSREIYARPAHPYTRALLSAIPALRPGGNGRIKLEGEPLSPISPSSTQCRYCGRCPIARARCRTSMPELREILPGREVRCHFAEEVIAGGA